MIATKNLKITKEINKGTFGVIYKVVHITDKKEYVMKIEKRTESSSFDREIKIYRRILNEKVAPPLLKYSSIQFDGKRRKYLLLPYYKYSLRAIVGDMARNRLMIYYVGYLGVNLLRDLHSAKIIHRDIKPGNFLVEGNRLLMIDFGLSVLESEASRYAHFAGTPKYASINTHENGIPTYRDDLFSLFYMLASILTGTLPWKGLKKDRKAIVQKKLNTPLRDIVDGDDILINFYNLLSDMTGPIDYEELSDLFYYSILEINDDLNIQLVN